ncbi:carcinoembryonic antigen-related cell adhesion molecule 1-like [Oryzias melastigma]|uniref:carcinoembryonic antigen-related cell adhesion molecule 1-like n=1 Tax=Oryzias melastigma TaxID=30732 RepID=UPI00168D726D|nr:carcinoembryonic antigen-related cell adhesion molecule 1-like [Oryzias melastigma]
MNSSSEVTSSDRVQITDGGSTLTVVHVTRYDEQSYRCRVFNHVSEGISDPVNILVSYGPENTKMSASPSQEFYEEGSDISLSCSADSRPSAQFTWFVNGTKLPDSGPELTLRNIQFSQRGDYSCQAFNSRTLTSEMSPSLSISVLHGPENVQIEGKDLINENDQIKLICSAESTPSATFTWRLNGSEIIGSSAEFLKEKAQSSDSGTYTCEAKNTVTEKQSTAEHELYVQQGCSSGCSSSGCSAGCIAGIVVGCLVVVAAASAGGFTVYKKRHNRKPDPQSAEQNHVYEEMSSVYENVGK